MKDVSNLVNGIIYHPKGSMCAACVNNKNDCSMLPFATMPTLEIYSKNDCEIHVVKCTDFRRV